MLGNSWSQKPRDARGFRFWGLNFGFREFRDFRDFREFREFREFRACRGCRGFRVSGLYWVQGFRILIVSIKFNGRCSADIRWNDLARILAC